MCAFIPPIPLPLTNSSHLAFSLAPSPSPLPRRLRRVHQSPSPSPSSSPPLACAQHQISASIAAAFITACTPGPTPYAQALRHFADKTLHAYRTGYSLSALQLELSSNPSSPRPLAPDEVELRAVWLALVYKTLRNINFPGGSTTSDMPPDRLDAFVKDVVVAVRRGYDMKRIQLEQLSVGEPRTDLESAVLGQSTRLVVTTISAADSALQNDDL